MEGYNPPIGWNWWQLKKFNATRQPFNCIKTTDFQTIINYWNDGGSKPSAADAKEWLFDMARKMHTDSTSCEFIPEMVASLNLDPWGVVDIKDLPGNRTVPYRADFNLTHAVTAGGPAAISFVLPEASRVKLSIINVNGRVEKNLVNGDLSAGPQSIVWNRMNERGNSVANGIYLYTFSCGENACITKRITLIK